MNTSTITSYLFKVLPFGLLFTVYTCTEGPPAEEVGETADGPVLTTLAAASALGELWGLTSAKSQSTALIPNNIDILRDARKISRQGQKTSYTFALTAVTAKSQGSGYVAENLVVELNADSTMSTYIFRYAPDMEWYGDPSSTLDTYTGNIEFSDVSGELFSQAYFMDGVPVESGVSMAKSTDGCDLDAYLICTELLHDDGSSYGESCDFIVTAYCPNPGGGPQGNPGGWDDEDETDVIGGGGSGEDEDDDTVETTPLLDPCHITDSCEETIVVEEPDNPINDIGDFLECFDTNQNAVLTIYVDQPIANSDTPFSVLGDKAGHAFIGIEQGNVLRVFGFYPEGNADPAFPSDPHTFGDNSNDSYDISISFGINAVSLWNIIDYSVGFNLNYDLNHYNCTDYVIDIAAICGLDLPDPQSDWAGGGGSNPGSFGESLRTAQLPMGFSLDEEGGTAPSNNGDCN